MCCEAKAEEKKGIKLNPGKLKQARERDMCAYVHVCMCVCMRCSSRVYLGKR